MPFVEQLPERRNKVGNRFQSKFSARCCKTAIFVAKAIFKIAVRRYFQTIIDQKEELGLRKAFFTSALLFNGRSEGGIFAIRQTSKGENSLPVLQNCNFLHQN